MTRTVPADHVSPGIACPGELAARFFEKVNDPWPAPMARNSMVISTPEPFSPGNAPSRDRPITSRSGSTAFWAVAPCRNGPCWRAHELQKRFG